MTLRLHNVHEQFPDLPAKALDYFHPDNAGTVNGQLQPRTVMDFASHISIPGSNPNSRRHPPYHRINIILQRMADLNLLQVMNRGSWMAHDASYICELNEETKSGILSTLNFVVYGFPVIYEGLRSSVIPLIHSKDGEEQIGTSFLHTHWVILTAAHCLEGADTVSIGGISTEQFKRSKLFFHKNRDLDLAAIRFEEPVLPNLSEIELGTGSVLDDVLVLGYPNVPGFVELLAAEKAAISARITGTLGSVATKAKQIFANTSLFLVTARVRGGFSGGPAINDRGVAVGLVSSQPASFEKSDASFYAKYDEMGYGVVVPSEEIIKFLQACKNGGTELVDCMAGSDIAFREFLE